jgi:hypothetical protein
MISNKIAWFKILQCHLNLIIVTYVQQSIVARSVSVIASVLSCICSDPFSQTRSVNDWNLYVVMWHVCSALHIALGLHLISEFCRTRWRSCAHAMNAPWIKLRNLLTDPLSSSPLASRAISTRARVCRCVHACMCVYVHVFEWVYVRVRMCKFRF